MRNDALMYREVLFKGLILQTSVMHIRGPPLNHRGGGGCFLNWTNALFHFLSAIFHLFHTLPQAPQALF